MWADGGHTGRPVIWTKEELQLTVQIVTRSDDVSGFMVLPRRWCVERTCAWLFRSRRLVRDYETLPTVHEWMVMWSMTMLMSRRPAHRRA
ncbi:transposase [Streptomyces sp. SID8358]|nr:transposase [Streptomyces sp. SID8358]